MKKILLCIIALILCIPAVTAQNAPQGMKYQAIARDLNGDVLSNQRVTLKINLQNGDEASTVYYSEFHESTTNKFGLFNLVIGNGKVSNGTFKSIPWSSQDVWMSISIMDEETEVFSTVSNSKLLAVPYAFHAGTAGEVSNNPALAKAGPKGGVPSQNWSLFGNSKSNPEKDKLGTTDSTDVVFVTNNKERLRITADGQIITGDGKFTIGGNLEVQGDSTTINKDLYVGRNVRLNFSEEFEPKGNTINYGDFTTEGYGQFDKNVTVKDTLFTRVLDTEELNIKADAEDGKFLASFENTNGGDGDGIKIKLGKKGAKNASILMELDSELRETLFFQDDEINKLNIIKNTFTGDISSPTELIKLGIPTSEELVTLASTACTMAVAIGNEIINFLNDELGLPLTIGDAIVPINGCDPRLAEGMPNSCANDGASNTIFVNDGWITDGTFEIFPDFPTIPEDVCADLFGPGTAWEFPEISLKDIYVSDPLNKENVFIEFSDKNDDRVGSIKAQSIENWAQLYFDKVKVYHIIATLKTLDKIKVINSIKSQAKAITKEYISIGVKYASGNGDYAEWLERKNPNEIIDTGDIVAIVGGKITKDLTNAEQVMAISHHPIVLGNTPEEGKEYLGNNIAFMGQIPVKIMGPVKSGDYIVGKGKLKGFGVAISPEKMSLEDFKHAVGRSWDANPESGPKMVNTVVGVHNGDYLNILKRYEAKFEKSEARLQSVEDKIDALSELISQSNKI